MDFDTPDKIFNNNKMTEIFDKTDNISNNINENFHNLNKIIINEFIKLNNENNNNKRNNNNENNNNRNYNNEDNNQSNYLNSNKNNYLNNNLNISEVEEIKEKELDTNDLFASIKSERNYNNQDNNNLSKKLSIKDEIEKDIISGKDLNTNNIHKILIIIIIKL